MIDLTPLDVRKKRGDFGKGLRGYDPLEVDTFLELVAERMEELVKENLAFRGKVETLGEKVVAQEGREQAIQDALVTAQELRQDVKEQANREAKLMEREARGRIEGMVAESEKLLTEQQSALKEWERRRDRFLKGFRTFLERELDTIEVELGRAPLEDATVDLELGRTTWAIAEDEEEDWDDDGDDAHDTDDTDATDDIVASNDVVATDGIAATDGIDDTDSVEDTDGDAIQQNGHEAEARPPEAAGEGEDVSVAEAADTVQVTVAAPEPPPAEPVSPEAEYEETEGVDERPEVQAGGDSLWLSSIMIDREDEDPE